MPDTFAYQKPPHWPNGANLRVLTDQLRQATFYADLSWVRKHPPDGENFTITFKFARDLTSQEKAELDALVASHDPSSPPLDGYTVSELQAGSWPVGNPVYARDGRKNGEGPGAGSGVLAYFDGTTWRRMDSGPLEA